MNLIKVENYEEMSQKAAEIIINKVVNNPKITLGLATGGTPEGTYQHLIENHQKNQTTYQHVKTVNLDEYIGLGATDPNSYRHYMNEHLFNHIDIDFENIHIPNGAATNLQEECRSYDYVIDQLGGVDLQILGIGRNGHIGFNEPQTPFNSKTHIVELAPSTRKANARYFNRFDNVPTHAITMGIASILKSKEILLLVSGEDKAEAMQRLQHGEISESFPASVLKKHNNVTIIADKKAISSCLVSP
ncbi:glucosamine-6-phosphate deaminase [Pseudalkalibacillus sp. A8]|uniref:glucosamine-6-phosphate deaminase n=1 Tax=Pseudalkalibacillus sp. A8 TaxID=3382641 RepID=UPI0038B649CF